MQLCPVLNVYPKNLTYRSANTTAYNTGVTAEPCDQGLCLNWPEPETADGQPVYDISYTLMVGEQNPDGSLTALNQTKLSSNNATYTLDHIGCLQFEVSAHYCGPSENIINVSDQPQPALFAVNVTDPDPVTGLNIRQDCGQFYLDWAPLESNADQLPVRYRVRVRQQINNTEWLPMHCTDCEELEDTAFTFTPAADTPEQSRLLFTVSSGRCGQYRNDSVESEVHALMRCPETTQTMPFTTKETTEVSEQEDALNKSTQPQLTSEVVGLGMVIMAFTTMLGL